MPTRRLSAMAGRSARRSKAMAASRVSARNKTNAAAVDPAGMRVKARHTMVNRIGKCNRYMLKDRRPRWRNGALSSSGQTAGHHSTPKYNATAPSWLWNWNRFGRVGQLEAAERQSGPFDEMPVLGGAQRDPEQQQQHADISRRGPPAGSRQRAHQVSEYEQEHRMGAERQCGRCNRGTVRPDRMGAERYQAQHQQRTVQFQMQRPEWRVE